MKQTNLGKLISRPRFPEDYNKAPIKRFDNPVRDTDPLRK